MRGNTRDTLLFDKMKKGSVEAFHEFYEQYSSLVYSIAFRMMKDQSEAEDLSHDVFLEVYHHPDRYNENKGSVEAWLAVKTRSRCLDRLRRLQLQAHKEQELRTSDSPAFDPTAETVLKKWEGEMVHTALNQLPEAQKEAIYSTYYKLKTQREVAQEYNRPLGTVKSLIRYGIRNLRKQLNQLGVLDSSREVKKNEQV